MTENVAGSSVSVAVATQSASQSISSGAGGSSTRMPSDSFKLLVRVANSSGLSGIEKSGLLRDIAFADRFVKPKYENVRRELMENIASTAAFLEKRSAQISKQASSRSARQTAVSQAVARYNQVSRAAPKLSDDSKVAERQVLQAQKSVERSAIVMTKKPLKEVKADVSKAEVAQVFQQQTRDVVAKVSADMPAIEVRALGRDDSVEISIKPLGGKSSDPELVLPGSGASSDAEFVQLALPGSGGGDVEALPLPGSGSGEEIVLNLPGSGGGDAEFRVESPAERLARLEALGLIDLDFGSAGDVVDEAVMQIGSNPEEAIAAVSDFRLPGSLVGSGESSEVDLAPALLSVRI